MPSCCHAPSHGRRWILDDVDIPPRHVESPHRLKHQLSWVDSVYRKRRKKMLLSLVCSIYSILGVSTLRFPHGSNTPRHALDEMDARLLWDILPPLALHTLPQLIDVGRRGFAFGELLLEVMPPMLNWIQIW